MFPLFSFPVIFSRLSIQLGGLLSPASLAIQGWCGSLLCPSSSRADPGEPAEQPKQGSGKSCSPQHRCKPGATEQR